MRARYAAWRTRARVPSAAVLRSAPFSRYNAAGCCRAAARRCAPRAVRCPPRLAPRAGRRSATRASPRSPTLTWRTSATSWVPPPSSPARGAAAARPRVASTLTHSSHSRRADASELEAFNVDWLGKYRGTARVALKPKTTAQVAALLSHCNARRLAVVPQGGNTGLVGKSQALLAH